MHEDHAQIATFSAADLEQLATRGIPEHEALRQLALLRNPPPPVRLDRPCTVGDGIVRLAAAAQARCITDGEAAAAAGRVIKFVPASGAATRMFKDLLGALQEEPRPSHTPAVRQFFERLDDFPFAGELRRLSGIRGVPATEEEERQILRTLLHRMRFAELPKALIPFHRVGGARTALEEQLLEGTRYTRRLDGTCRMHFTVSPDVRREFESALADLVPAIERRRQGAVLAVSLSEQHPSTDTLAIDAAGEPFRTGDGSLLLRPSGHGALLRNLQPLGGDLVVIKNIDNVVPDEAGDEVLRWKRILIGYLRDLQAEVFRHLEACNVTGCPDARLDEAVAFGIGQFGRHPGVRLRDADAKRRFVLAALDRPVRVCGVVPNEGEPGGAPFWIAEADGHCSLQIVEASQVDMGDPEQAHIFGRATHFNPVDLVCGLRSWRGEAFDLSRFVDPSTAFVGRKSFEGRELTALERPGLWNGSMAGWNTVCVEVPATTFAPVKTVLDLLRPQHQYRPGAAR